MKTSRFKPKEYPEPQNGPVLIEPPKQKDEITRIFIQLYH